MCDEQIHDDRLGQFTRITTIHWAFFYTRVHNVSGFPFLFLLDVLVIFISYAVIMHRCILQTAGYLKQKR